MKELIENLLKLQNLEFDDAISGDDQRITHLRAQIPEPILGHYDRLVARGKKGVAGVRGQVCTGCHMRVPLAVTLNLMHDTDIQICESCGRYLYLAPAPTVPKVHRLRKKRRLPAPPAELQTA